MAPNIERKEKIKSLEREQLDIKSVNVGNFKLMGSVITNSVDSRTAVVAVGGRIQGNHVKERAPVTRETNPTLRKRKVALRNKCCVLESQGGLTSLTQYGGIRTWSPIFQETTAGRNSQMGLLR